MGSDIGVKMGVTGLAQFKQGMQQAQQSVKTLDAALKLNEKQYKASGDAEAYMQQKSKLLQQQMQAQNKVIKEGQQALSAMEKNGVNSASKAYQQMQQQVLGAQAALLDMQGSLDSVGSAASDTAQKTDKLADSLNGINKKVSFDAVLNGIGKITSGMEAAARKVESLARDVWDTMAMAASWADNENTLAAMYGIDVETLQKMQHAAEYAETSVDTIIKSRQKLKQNMASDSQEISEAFTQLGVSVGYFAGKQGEMRVFRDWEDVFWDTGEALLNYSDAIERDVLAQKIFGKSWMELMPMFMNGREKYEQALEEAPYVSQENIDKLNTLSDALVELQGQYEVLKNTVLSELAPAFTEVSKALADLLARFNEYLQTEEGQQKLEELSTAVTELFSGLTDVDFSTALETASGVLDTITEALGWIADNKDTVIGAIKGIGFAFLTLKAAEVVGSLAQGALALKNLLGGGGGGNNNGGGAVLPPGKGTGRSSGGGSGSSVGGAGGGSAAGQAAKKAAQAAGASGVVGTVAGMAAVAAIAGVESYLIDKAGTKKYEEFDEEFAGYMEQTGETLTELDQTLIGLRDIYQGDTEDPMEALKNLNPNLLRLIDPDNPLWLMYEGYGSNWGRTIEKEAGPVMWEWVGQIAEKALEMAKNGTTPGSQTSEPEAQPAEPAVITEETAVAMADAIPDLASVVSTLKDIYEGETDDPIEALKALDPEVLRLLDPDNPLWLMYEGYGKDWNRTVDAEAGPALWAWIEELAENAPEVEVAPELPDDTAATLEQDLAGLGLTVPVTAEIVGEADGNHANGLPFVPFDGYIAALHRGERIVPANQNKNYTVNSNLYAENINMSGHTDVNGLAAAIAERTRHTMSSFGG